MSVSYEDFSNICRFCLHKGDLQHFTPLKIWNLFKIITNIEVTENDILPKNVCKICLNRLEDISLFIDRCRENDALLKKIYEDVKEEENNIILIDLDNDSVNNYDIVKFEGIFIRSEAENEENASLSDTKNKLTLDKDTTYECPKCFKKFPFAESLRRHVLTHEGVKPFICNICKKGYAHQTSLDEHMNIHTGTIPYLCSYCGKGFVRHRELIVHVYRNHNTDKEKIPKHLRKYAEKRVHLNLKCEICGKIFSSRQGFANHKLIHKGEKKFLCNICGKKFIAKATLEQHIRIHTGDSPFECKECGRRFKQRSSLRVHMCNNVSDKSLNCPHCDKRYYSKNSLAAHILNHKGCKPHKCNICEKTFAFQSLLNKHVKTHNEERDAEKPFLCPICGKRLAQPHSLKIHMRLHTGEAPYVCSVCEKGYHDSSNLKRHFNRHHGPDNKLNGTTVLMRNDETNSSSDVKQ